MHLHNVIGTPISDPNYSNETFRARHHYKEEHCHNAPYRRSRDFKPIGYGSFNGLPNYKHSEPFALLKNIKEIYYEDHSFGIKFFKSFVRGALAGGVLGYAYFLGAPSGNLEMSKLAAAAGNKAYSGRAFRVFKSVAPRYGMLGGMVTMSYTILTHLMRHHDEGNPRPMIFDHYAATTLVTMGATAYVATHPFHIFVAGFSSLMIICPTSWWAMNQFRLNPMRSPNIFYENNTTAEEVERFRMQDTIELTTL